VSATTHALSALPDVHDAGAPSRPSIRIAIATSAGAEPPAVLELTAPSAAALVERAFAEVARRSSVPVVAIREIIENFVHARFAGAVITVFEEGRAIRCSDAGPGIADRARALSAGFTSATERDRDTIRGVGSGLGLAERVMGETGGTIEIEDNLGTGTVVTLRASGADPVPAAAEADGRGHALMALLLEIGPASAADLAGELGVGLGECGRDLVLLEHRGLVCRDGEGARKLTDDGARAVATLF